MQNEVIVSRGKQLLTMLFATWLVAGVFVDGYAHNHGVVETFFTPWHAILYSGFIATAIWMLWVVYRIKQLLGSSWAKSIPLGYHVGLAGVLVFLAGGVSDMIWHMVFGIEEAFDALLSPSHLMLLVGALMILTSPFRSGWSGGGSVKPGWGEFLPVLLSLSLTISMISFFLMYAWTFRFNLPSYDVMQWYMADQSTRGVDDNTLRGLVYIFLNTAMFMYPVFLLIKRWIVPIGTFTVLFTLVSALMTVLDGFESYPGIIVLFAAGLFADAMYKMMRPSPDRLWSVRIFALAVPIFLWSFYFGLVYINGGIGWSVEMWTGSIVKAALVSLSLSLLALSPKMRKERWR
jgi:hypothetical protein